MPSMVTLLSYLKPKRYSLQFRLRTLFVLVAVAAMPCVWMAWRMETKRKERAAKAAIESLGGYVWYRWHYDSKTVPPGPEWLRGLLGDDFFTDVNWVFLTQSNDGDAAVTYVKEMTQLRILTLSESQLTDEGLSNVEGLNGLQRLHLDNTHITDNGLKYLEGLTSLNTLLLAKTQTTDAGVSELQKALPNCEIKR